ncbi:nucleoplasmin-2 isoform X2 [Marmota marmota marmota]|uniref:nucleoplasmin-2 isoform X2 n=1 Tax=Marmota marmota marmota TaxID=9994 RepID=UPI002093978B|nr:nucleoplasmin-2 isoform X2 [Marmota marmota marmota]
MSRPSISSTAEKAKTLLWGGELNLERRSCTFRPQAERKENCRLLLNAICLGEKAKDEVNRVEIVPPTNQEDKKTQPITIASLKASVLPMVAMTGVEFSPPVTFHLRAGSGPVFLSGQECYETSDLPWEEEEEEEEEVEEEEEEEEEEDDDEADVSLEDTPVKQVKRPSLQKQTSVAKKKKLDKEEETERSSLPEKSPVRKEKGELGLKQALTSGRYAGGLLFAAAGCWEEQALDGPSWGVLNLALGGGD